MNPLAFESDSSRDGALLKAYMPHWHWARPGGSYRAGRDFLWLEYEVHRREMAVRIQVEGPAASVDPGLNAMKRLLVQALLRDSATATGSLTLIPGRAVDAGSIARNKCTTVLKAIIPASSASDAWAAEARRQIRMVDAAVGSWLDEHWQRIAVQLA